MSATGKKTIARECGEMWIYEQRRSSVGQMCGGMKICEDTWRRNANQICQHNKRRYRCKLCGGAGVCEQRSEQRTCSSCEVTRRKNKYRICEHNRRKFRCKLCRGPEMCEHGRPKRTCKTCRGSLICEQYRRKQSARSVDERGFVSTACSGAIGRPAKVH